MSGRALKIWRVILRSIPIYMAYVCRSVVPRPSFREEAISIYFGQALLLVRVEYTEVRLYLTTFVNIHLYRFKPLTAKTVLSLQILDLFMYFLFLYVNVVLLLSCLHPEEQNFDKVMSGFLTFPRRREVERLLFEKPNPSRKLLSRDLTIP